MKDKINNLLITKAVREQLKHFYSYYQEDWTIYGKNKEEAEKEFRFLFDDDARYALALLRLKKNPRKTKLRKRV
jgi:hypothetical protein